MFLGLFLVSGAIMHQAHGFTWYRPRQAETRGLESSEVAAVLRAEAVLSEYGQRDADCFRRASRLIRVQCSQLDMDENERVRAAISMTLCELATAKHHSFPLECAPFSSEAPQLDSDAQSHCVGALAQSAQFWSSYSGYLREIPQLCFAFRRWNDIDTAKDLYRNATLEKIQLLRMLFDREKITERHILNWDSRLAELHEVTGSIERISHGIVSASGELSARLFADVDKMRQFMLTLLLEVYERHEENRTLALQNMVVSLTNLHNNAMQNAVSEFEQILATHLQTIFALSVSQSQVVFDIATEASNRVNVLNEDLQNLHESTTSLSQTIGQAVITLNESKAQMQELRQLQEGATTSAAGALQALIQLTNLTETEFRSVNQSAVLLKQALVPHSEQFMGWWSRTFWALMSIILRVDSQQLVAFPLFHALSMAMSILFAIVRSCSSMILAGFFLVLSSRRTSHQGPTFSRKDAMARSDSDLVATAYRGPRRLSRIPDRLWRTRA